MFLKFGFLCPIIVLHTSVLCPKVLFTFPESSNAAFCNAFPKHPTCSEVVSSPSTCFHAVVVICLPTRKALTKLLTPVFLFNLPGPEDCFSVCRLLSFALLILSPWKYRSFSHLVKMERILCNTAEHQNNTE